MNTKVWYLPYSNANARMVHMVHIMVCGYEDACKGSRTVTEGLMTYI